MVLLTRGYQSCDKQLGELLLLFRKTALKQAMDVQVMLFYEITHRGNLT